MTSEALQRLRDDVARAVQVVAPSWPLSSVIAVNPLAGFEDRPFEQALGEAAALFGTRGVLTIAEFRAALEDGRVDLDSLRAAQQRRPSTSMAELVGGPDEPRPECTSLTIAERHDREHGTQLRRRIDIEMADWCARWSTMSEPGDYWDEWRRHRSGIAASLPDAPDEALMAALRRLRVPTHAQCEYLRRQVAVLPGWAAHLRWREEHAGGQVMIGHLAAMVVSEAQLLDGIDRYVADGPDSPPPAASLDERPFVWLDAYERAVHDRLLVAIDDAPAPTITTAPAAQVVCCIDVRSEGLRRHLEACGPYETFGYAGFFGLAAHIVPVTGRGGTDQCPVLLTPAVTIAQHGPVGSAAATAVAIDDAWHAAKYNPIAPLALAEGAGWLAGPLAAIRTAAPGLSAKVARLLPHGRPAPGTVTFDRTGVDVSAQASVVGSILGLGIGTAPAPLVVLCGHDARADNNPMESSLACGACGGHGGAPNARVVAAMANDPDVRAELARRGRPIPDGTWFLAAVHDTTSDQVEVFDLDLVPATHLDAVGRLQADLERAGEGAALERARTLPGRTRTVGQVRRRARDWAEPVAELGLAGNMAFVIGPRSLTAHADLGRRVFLHSYDAAGDPDGSTLAGILTAPLVVAQWINAQYYFSATDPERFGAGSKAVHNVIGDIGVLSGAGGDLRRGLPLQSVRAGSRLLHEPVRLLAVVEGSLDHIDRAIAESSTLHRLVTNNWIHLVARPGADSSWQRRIGDGWEIHRPAPEVHPWPAAV